MTTITKGKTTAAVTRTARGDWAVAFGRFSATLPADGPEIEAWVAAGQAETAPSDRITELAKKVTAKAAPATPAPWRGQYRTDAYVPLDGEEQVTLYPLRSRTWGPGTPSEVVAAAITCTSARCRERDAEGNEAIWRRIVVRFPGSDTLDPRASSYSDRHRQKLAGEVIEGRDPAEVLAEHEAWHRENFPIHPRVALSNWITNQYKIPMPELSDAERAEFDRQLAIAKAERRGEVTR